MARGKLEDAISTLESWLPSEQREYGELIAKILASMPGGERLEDMGIEGFKFLGWQELDMLGKLIDAIESREDVEEAVDRLFGDEDEPEEEEG